MKLSEADVEEMLKSALGEALKDRFSKIASNELSLGPEEGESEFRRMFANLKIAYDQVMRIAPEFFTPE